MYNFRYIIAGVYQMYENTEFKEPLIASVWDSVDDNSKAIEDFLVRQTISNENLLKRKRIEKMYSIYDVVPNIEDNAYPMRNTHSVNALIDLIWKQTGATVNSKYAKVRFSTLLDLEVFAVKRIAGVVYLLYLDREGELDWKRLEIQYKFKSFFNREKYISDGVIEKPEAE